MRFLRRFVEWLEKYEETLERLAHFVTPLALIATVASLIVTSCISQQQLRLSALSFQGTMLYQALKDTREVGLLYHNGKASESVVFATMQSVFLERELGTIPAQAWGVFERDFCITLEDEHLQRAWEAEDKAFYSQGFISYMRSLLPLATSGCKRRT